MSYEKGLAQTEYGRSITYYELQLIGSVSLRCPTGLDTIAEREPSPISACLHGSIRALRIVRIEDVSVSTELRSTVDREEIDASGGQLVSVLVGEGASREGLRNDRVIPRFARCRAT